MTKLAYRDLAAIHTARKASKFGVALLAGATLLSSLAAEPAHAGGRGVAIGVGAFGLGILLNEAARSEESGGGYNDYDDDDSERSEQRRSKPRATRNRSNPPEVQVSEEVLETQKSLNQAGYDAGPEDGIRGRQMTAAVKAFQRGRGYEETGKLNAAQRKDLYVVARETANTRNGGGAPEVQTTGEVSHTAASPEQGSYKPNFGNETAPTETKTVAGHENTRQSVPETDIDPQTLAVEKALFSLQMIKGVPDGKIDAETIAAIKKYQSHLNESPSGELTPEQRENLISMVQAYFSFEKK